MNLNLLARQLRMGRDTQGPARVEFFVDCMPGDDWHFRELSSHSLGKYVTDNRPDLARIPGQEAVGRAAAEECSVRFPVRLLVSTSWSKTRAPGSGLSPRSAVKAISGPKDSTSDIKALAQTSFAPSCVSLGSS